jgi:2-methylcitrate dehydratase
VDATTRRLAEFAADLRFEDLPAEVVDVATVRIVDSLGCAVGGMRSEQADIARTIAPRVNDGREGLAGRILGSDWSTSPEHAAFANTCMVRNLDFNDRYPHVHPSDMIGGLLAGATAPGVDGRRFVTAVVAAYEVATRMADAADMRDGWDSGYAAGVGAVAGLANLLGLKTDHAGEALSLIETANVPLRSTRAGVLSLWKGAATAYCMLNAVLVTRLAQEGMTGPEKAIEGRHGLWDKVSGEFEIPALPDQGGGWNILRTSLKFWPVEYSAQTAVWAGKRLATSIPVDQLASVRLGAHKRGWHEIASEPAKWDPQSRETADHSMPYIFVRAMQHDGIDLDVFEPEQYLEPAARPLMAKVTVEADDEAEAAHPEGMLLTVRAEALDGRTESFSIRDPKGHWRNPMSTQEVEAKFRGLADPAYGPDRAAALYDFWSTVSEHAELGTGLSLFESPAT